MVLPVAIAEQLIVLTASSVPYERFMHVYRRRIACLQLYACSSDSSPIEFGFLAFRYPFAYAEGCIAGRRAASGHLSLVTANETGLDLRLGKVGDSTVQATSAKISAASCDRESLIHLIRKERFVMRVVEPGTVSNLLGRFLTFAVVVSMQVGAQNVPLRQGLLEQLNSSLKELAERVSPAVVEVKVLGYGVDDDREDNDGDNGRSLVKQRLSGAGVILDSNGYIVTNAHLDRKSVV